jgi:hypothetical protein
LESTPINADSLTLRSESALLSPMDEVTINNTMINSAIGRYDNEHNNNSDNISSTLLGSGLRYPRTPPSGRRTNNNHNNNNDINNHISPHRIRFNIP